ncbi:MAG: hypothetical protein K6G65_01815 [Lachnospiraceae bacterium]|nr:hypothetical protein [Lachnospiraceae bacterium]
MLNEKKIRFMSKLAIAEEKEKKSFRITGYYRSDYIRMHLMQDLIYVTIGYALIWMMVAFYKLDAFFADVMSINYVGLLRQMIIGYIIVLIVYAVGSITVSAVRYSKAHRFLLRFRKNLMVLERYYEKKQDTDRED